MSAAKHAKDSSKPAVAVMDADTPPGLAFVRSLGRYGVPVHVYSPRKAPVARLSRYCKSFETCPDPEDAERFLPWAQEKSRSGKFELVAPTSDLLAFYMAEFPECFPQGQQKNMPTREHVLAMLFKDKFDAACQAHNIRAPWTSFPLSVEEALKDAAGLPYPVILKPKSHVGVGWARGVVVKDERELRREFKPYPTRPETAMLMKRFPELAWPMIQEYVPGALKHLYSISGLMGLDGSIIALSGSKKTQQWPPTLGVGIVFESWYEKGPVELGIKFAQGALGSGIFELELIWDARTNDYVAIDLNPRAHGHIAFDIARNNDLPLLWYRQMLGEKLAPLDNTQSDVRWIHSIPYHVGNLIGVARGPSRKEKLAHYMTNMRGKTVDIINDLGDPLPSFAHTFFMLRHPGGLIKPFLRGH